MMMMMMMISYLANDGGGGGGVLVEGEGKLIMKHVLILYFPVLSGLMRRSFFGEQLLVKPITLSTRLGEGIIDTAHTTQ